MTRVISEKTEYPNMLPMEIVKSGVALSGDALEMFIETCREHQEDDYNEAKQEVRDAINAAINELEGIRDDL